MSEKGEWNPGQKYTRIVSQIQDILEDGEQRTVRGVYYALEARGNKWEYRYVKRAVREGRRAGYIDPAQIVDSSRQAVSTAGDGWTNPREYLDNRVDGIWNGYWEDFWKYTDGYVEVWLEKAALASVLQPICDEYNVRLEALRGDWSDSKTFRATRRIVEKIQDGNNVTVLYFGDFNPSGYHAPVSILDTMEYYGMEFQREFPNSEDPAYFDVEHGLPATFPSGGSFNVDRVAMTLDHIKKYDLPENPVPSGSDKDKTLKRRFREYVTGGRDTNVELDAFREYHQDELTGLLESRIRDHFPEDVRERVRERNSEAREALEQSVILDDDGLDERFQPPITEDERHG